MPAGRERLLKIEPWGATILPGAWYVVDQGLRCSEVDSGGGNSKNLHGRLPSSPDHYTLLNIEACDLYVEDARLRA